MLIQMLDLEAGIWPQPTRIYLPTILTVYPFEKFTVKPRTIVGATFLKFLSAENESAFDILYCIAFKLMDQQWLSMHASYMEFNVNGDEINKETAGERADAGRYNAS
ncbi:unnamed protein product [Brassica rapa subsp. narinosa]